MTYRQPTLGILGAGQLGRMLALAAIPLGVGVICLDPKADACAGSVSRLITANFRDPSALKELADACGVITYEFENVPVESLRFLEHSGASVFPGREALHITQDRLQEKTMAHRLGFRTTRFVPIDQLSEVALALEITGLPAFIKTRRNGYDGKGQRRVTTLEEAKAAVIELGTGTANLIVEASVPFLAEWSIIAARDRSGSIVYYPLTKNVHRDGILKLSRACPSSSHAVRIALEQQAHAVVHAFMEKWQYVGVLAIEFFEDDDGLLVNEIAPRVHNSGHWTIDAARTSQFENHVRAVLGFPLGPTDATSYAAMVNLIGDAPDPQVLLETVPDLALHLYGKAAAPGRKLGHLTICGETEEARDAALDRLFRKHPTLNPYIDPTPASSGVI